MQKGGSYTTHYIKSEKSPGSPIIFQNTSKHPKDQHIPENMHKTSMQKHISDDLVRLEKRRSDIMKSEKIFHPPGAPVFKCPLN
jgi:hypothetical protein